jgi:hypothetical protein
MKLKKKSLMVGLNKENKGQKKNVCFFFLKKRMPLHLTFNFGPLIFYYSQTNLKSSLKNIEST